ncbi:terminase small subunit [Hymenobacter crusticola]|uniref:Terminase small subunit n=1 Tax=Hymenobacter crusticola TaxID=1770526 RepID=A0A243W5Z9_9BACT|nr:terminase small subunit [Hymenobacter crusticola]OUJ69189.1 hypothetical protein BXP70_26745 [Hymenobacter crusticola]
MPTPNPTKSDKFSEKQLRWAEEYPKDFNATAAARRAGYAPESAGDSGWLNKQIPALMALVDERHRSLTMSADEATRHLSDMAATRLNDFLVVRPVQGYEQVEMYVSVLADKQREEITFMEAFAQREGIALSGEFGLTPMGKRLQAAKEQLLEYELTLMRHGPDAVLLVASKPIIHEVAELDLVAIARAKNEGRIKSFKQGKEGVSVEMYGADGAARDILKLNGRYEKHNEQKRADVVITLGGKPFPGQTTTQAQDE